MHKHDLIMHGFAATLSAAFVFSIAGILKSAAYFDFAKAVAFGFAGFFAIVCYRFVHECSRSDGPPDDFDPSI